MDQQGPGGRGLPGLCGTKTLPDLLQHHLQVARRRPVVDAMTALDQHQTPLHRALQALDQHRQGYHHHHHTQADNCGKQHSGQLLVTH